MVGKSLLKKFGRYRRFELVVLLVRESIPADRSIQCGNGFSKDKLVTHPRINCIPVDYELIDLSDRIRVLVRFLFVAF